MRSIFLFIMFFLLFYGDHRGLHSFPTRRSSDLGEERRPAIHGAAGSARPAVGNRGRDRPRPLCGGPAASGADRKSTRLNSSHRCISYAVFCLKKKNNNYVLVDDNLHEYKTIM